MKLPFCSAGMSLDRLKKSYWDIKTENHDELTMQQWSMWIDMGRLSLMLFIRWEN